MTTFRRAQVVACALVLIALVTDPTLWGDEAAKSRDRIGGSRTIPGNAERPPPLAEMGRTKFDRPGVVSYTALDGTHLFGMQIKPELPPSERQGADILILIDTSASQVGLPLRLATEIAEQLTKHAGPDDRVALWTVNTPAGSHKHIAGFKAANAANLSKAFEALREEIPLGNTDLHSGLTQALDLFKNQSRDGAKAILFLGDGFSTYNPISAAERTALSEKFIKEKVRFYPVPLGPMLDYQNLHGFTSGTGGLVVRPMPSEKVGNLVKRLETAFHAPVLYPSEFKIAGAKECYPARLPPLRGDAPTLVVGKHDAAKELAYEVAGTLAGKKIIVKGREELQESEPDNFFLVTMIDQWKRAPEEPALMRADRALAFAQQINLVARDELLGQAQMALMLDERPAARKLFDQAEKLDPNDAEAKGGLALLDALDQGKVKREDLKKQLEKQDGKGLMIEKVGKGGKAKVEFRRDEMRNLVALAQADKGPAVAPAPIAPAGNDDNLERQQLQKQAVEEQRINHIVDDALRQARRLLQTDPDTAVDLLKRVLAGIRDNNDLRPQFRQGLVGRLEPALRNVTTDAIKAKQDMEERLVLLAQAEQRFNDQSQLLQDQERTRERMRRYRNLMNQARYEDAFQEGLALMQDSVNQGRPVSPAATAATDIGLLSYHLREEQELKRIRQERFLATLLQVERSHIPFPDEPPIQFPPTATWKQLTQLRKDKYESSGLTDDDPQTLKKLKELKSKMESSVTLDGFDANTPLKEALGFISERYGITILMDVEAFKETGIMEPENQPVKLPKMVNVRLDTVLRLLLAQANATFILRRDYIEVTTPQRQAAEKTLRVYPVADLVTPIPNSVNQSAVNQTQANSLLGIGGGAFAMGGFNMGMGMAMGMGGFNMGMAMGMGGMAMGMGGMGMAMGMGGMNMGMGGMAMGMGGMGGMGGMMMGMGGYGGGFGGVGMAQGGAGGNRGGQFGLQGGDTSQLLIRLITQVVGKPEDWMPLQQNMGGQAGFPGAGAMGFGFGMMGMFGGMMMGIPPADPNEGYGNPNEAGALGYYSPTRALIVKGTSRVHTRLGGGLLAPRPPAGGAGAGALLIEPGKKPVQVAGAGDKKDPKKPTPAEVKKTAPVVVAPPITGKDWEKALAHDRFESGMIIATADYLVAQGQFRQAAAFLKADLRTATVVRPWVYEALSLSLKLSKGSIEDIERAELSGVDMMPSDAQGYLKASRAMADNKRWDRAVAFCRQASILSPDSPEPYADALSYAREVRDVDAMDWASSNLLKNDWPAQNRKFHGQAQEELKHLKDLLAKEKNADPAQAARLDSARGNLRRDLVITLDYKGQAELDPEIKEPIGTICSFQQRQTPGGGTLQENLLDPHHKTYVAGEAFSGDYEITVKRMWGRPQGSSVTLQVIEHQGTPEERIILRKTLVADFEKDSPKTIVTLKAGRRTSLASVSPTPMQAPVDERKEHLETGDQVLNKLRALADPDLLGSGGGVRGGFGGLPPIAAKMTPDHSRTPAMPTPAYQGKAASVVGNGVEMTYRPVFSADRKIVGVSLNPVFQTLDRTGGAPKVLNPAIPGR